MTYYTLPKLFKNNNYNVISNIQIVLQLVSDLKDDSLLEKLLNTLVTDANKQKYEEIKALYSFTDLLNLKLSDEIHHPKSYFAFIEITKVCNLFNRNNIKSLHMSDSFDYLDALYQLRKKKDKYVFLSDQYFVNMPSYIVSETMSDTISIQSFIYNYKNELDLISINHDTINEIVKSLFIALLVQKSGGNVVLKMKRLNTYIAKEIIYLLMSLYENVLIIKPKIVNSVNEYKYIIATNLTLNVGKFSNILINYICHLHSMNENEVVTKLLNIDLPQLLVNKIDECELIMSENTLTTHMKILNSIHINNVNTKSLEKKNENETRLWLKENNIA